MESKAKWERLGACLGRDSDLFFPEKANLYEKTCTGCPVINQCRSYALVHDEDGIWGGTTRRQRKRMDPRLVNTLREMYFKAGILEWRSGEVADFIRQHSQTSQSRFHYDQQLTEEATLAG